MREPGAFKLVDLILMVVKSGNYTQVRLHTGLFPLYLLLIWIGSLNYFLSTSNGFPPPPFPLLITNDDLFGILTPESTKKETFPTAVTNNILNGNKQR